jgi:hypothetical protein
MMMGGGSVACSENHLVLRRQYHSHKRRREDCRVGIRAILLRENYVVKPGRRTLLG